MSLMFKALDEYLDQITMYRLLLYYLIGLILVAIGLSAAGDIHYHALSIAESAVILLVVCWVTNQIFARFLKLPINSDSAYITALILALIITPPFVNDDFKFLAAAGGLAIASKYLITYKKRHIFNPAGIAVVLTALGPQQSASWWIGNSAMLPFVVVGGVLLTRRIRRGAMVTSFLVTGLIASLAVAGLHHASLTTTLHQTIFSSALFFLAFVMLTEPLTAPVTKKMQVAYGVLVGLLFPPQVHIGSLYSTPERALSIGNIFAFIVNPKVRDLPAFLRKEKITPDSADFVFAPEKSFIYLPGQYMEFTLPHEHIDSRGQRRYFTLASSPSENTLRIGVKFYPKSSTFKKALLGIDQKSTLVAANLGGDFVLPQDKTKKVVLIAGGIGVTPYRSMIKYMLDMDEQRTITLLYAANTAKDIAYRDVFDEARTRLGVKALYVLSKADAPISDDRYRTGYITDGLIKTEVPDFADRLFYISGPHAMVVSVESALRNLGVHQSHIKTDFFSGYA